MNKTILLDNRPVGKPTLNNFRFETGKIPVPNANEVLLKTLYVSVDPYLRGRMNDSKSYIPPFEIGKPIQSGIIAEIVESNHEGFKKGDFVSGNLEWKEYQVSNGKGLNKIESVANGLSVHLGLLGMTGLTAYFGMTEIGMPKAGETLVVSGAAGAVGSIVGQLGKLMGCKVVGTAGSDEKVDMLINKFKFDAAINYKTTQDIPAALKIACPQGIDIYFDNVGGEISDAVLGQVNKFARIVVCGAISMYNETEIPVGPRVQPYLVKNSALMRGFIVSDFYEKFPEGVKLLNSWWNEAKLTYAETIIEGFDQIPQAFLDLFEGKNEGKMVVKV